MRLLAFALLPALAAAPAAAARIQTFPYQAVVETDDAPVYSGPGRNTPYYVTDRLKRGERVTVHRHDPGGWHMVAPPPGSFSWIRAEYVRREAGNRGVLTENHVVVRVGSALGDMRDIEQVRLSTGDRVEILEEASLQSEQGSLRMYKIVPPAGEYRWVQGSQLVPVEIEVRRQNDRDPFAIPSFARRDDVAKRHEEEPGRGERAQGTTGNGRPTADGPLFGSRPMIRVPDAESTAAGAGDTDPGPLDADRKRLRELDERFREIIRQDTSQWDFTELERGYRELHARASGPASTGEIERRFPALEKYKSIKAEYDKLVAVTTETARREQLLSAGREVPPTTAPAGTSPADSDRSARGPAGLTPTPVASTPAVHQPANSPQGLAGAGIVQRIENAAPGGPQHALVAPDGRLLALLQAEGGIDLDRYVGREMGIHGRRWNRPDLGTDFILVHRLMPVRLIR